MEARFDAVHIVRSHSSWYAASRMSQMSRQQLMVVAIAGVVGPAIATIGGVLVKEFHTTFHMVATWSGYQFWPAGVGGLVCSAVSRVWGKRTVYLMSLILILAGAIWNACARTPNSFLGSRILQGFGLGAVGCSAVAAESDADQLRSLRLLYQAQLGIFST